jgi:hypothetical protein
MAHRRRAIGASRDARRRSRNLATHIGPKRSFAQSRAGIENRFEGVRCCWVQASKPIPDGGALTDSGCRDFHNRSLRVTFILV